VTSASVLTLERATVSGFTTGIVAGGAAGTSLVIRNSTIRNNTASGVVVGPSATGAADLLVDDVAFERNGTGLTLNQRGAAGAIRNSAFSGNATGIAVAPSAGNNGQLEVRRTTFEANATAGLAIGSAGATTLVSLSNSLIANGGVGILTQQSGGVNVENTTITRNTTGLQQLTGGTAVSFGNNRLLNNTANGAFTSTTPLQ
jgi:hypothetical protein